MTECCKKSKPKVQPKPWEMPYLYILFRDDLDTSRGKVGAQTAHAANKLDGLMAEIRAKKGDPALHALAVSDKIEEDLFELYTRRYSEAIELYDEWRKSSGQNFGVTIVLSVPNFQTLASVTKAAQNQGFPADFVLDETYPVPDGKHMHYVPCTTCSFVFGRKGELAALTQRFELLT